VVNCGIFLSVKLPQSAETIRCVGKALPKPTNLQWSFGNLDKYQDSGSEEYGREEVIYHGVG
jgi:hypothetical protein